MPGVTVKDVSQQEFVRALAAFLRKSGKLKVPNGWTQSSWPNIKSLPPLVRTGSTHELLLRHGTARHLYLRGGARVDTMTKIYGGRQRNVVRPSHFNRGSKSMARRVLPSLEGLKMVGKDQDGGRKLTPQGQRSGQDCRTGGSCQQEALEQRMLG
ncbi:hypothetical protein U0070_011499 [Myodes glareolus]|uniref:40S ribosomal protein S19 n=1 Tax=Myodes glareolus TaxID=447135 RepID=A0AAW0J105_MYOGA